ncbi:hypothetical protein OAN61_00520 [bacterium]|nr:hypothetical protein [bacterium]
MHRVQANPPADLLAKEGWTLQEYKTKVNFARWFMINTCVKAEKVG